MPNITKEDLVEFKAGLKTKKESLKGEEANALSEVESKNEDFAKEVRAEAEKKIIEFKEREVKTVHDSFAKESIKLEHQIEAVDYLIQKAEEKAPEEVPGEEQSLD